MQNAEGVKSNMLKANVALVPSSCENSSNSICEAQLLGVPCLASYVGGNPDMIPSRSMGELYNFYDFTTLAYKVCSIFEMSSKYDNTEMRMVAKRRNDRFANSKRTLDIYKIIEAEIYDNGKDSNID